MALGPVMRKAAIVVRADLVKVAGDAERLSGRRFSGTLELQPHSAPPRLAVLRMVLGRAVFLVSVGLVLWWRGIADVAESTESRTPE